MRRSPSFQRGDLISFLGAMNANRLLVLKVFFFDLTRFPSHYEVPVHYILGEADTITPPALAKEYFETIDAPRKTFSS